MCSTAMIRTTAFRGKQRPQNHPNDIISLTGTILLVQGRMVDCVLHFLPLKDVLTKLHANA